MASKKVTVVVKSFRLFDFHVYDEQPQQSASSSSDENSSHHSGGNNYQKTFTIQMFGMNEHGQTCAISITDYLPFFYVKVADSWNQDDCDELYRTLKRLVGKFHAKDLLNASLVSHNKLYGFTGGKKSKFVKLEFQTISAMNKTKGLWYIQTKTGRRVYRHLEILNTPLELYESKLPPILRYFHIHNISPSGWVRFRLNQVTHIPPDEKTTTCTYEFRMKKAQLESLPDKETSVPYKICSFDIEASSSHGDFPVPIKSYKRLATNMVDVYDKLAVSVKAKFDTTKCHTLLQKIILSAFQYGKCDGIDIVFPKTTVSKAAITNHIQSFLQYQFEDNGAAGVESNVATIESMFEKISAQITEGATTGYDNDNENDDDEPGAADTSFQEIEIEADDAIKPIVKHRPAKPSNTMNVLDVLHSETLTRDEKIQRMNEALMTFFPALEGDKVTFIGSTFLRYGETSPYLNHCLVLDSSEPVSGAEIVTTTTEKDLLLQWADLIQRENPDIIIGYNIFGFDYEFMFRRAQENECDLQFLKLSRRKHEISAIIDNNTQQRSLENTKIVLATGEYDLRYPKLHGRLQIDVYTYFRREFNLASYKLDDVAGNFIRDTIKFVEIRPETDTTMLYTKNIAGLNTSDYIHIELSGFTSDYYKDGKKFQVTSILRDVEHDSNRYNVICIGSVEEELVKAKSINWCMAKDDVSPQDIFRLSNGSASDRAKVAKYCIQDCNLVHHLFQKIDILTGYVEMSRICSVPISFLVFRGQGIKLTSFVAKKCREKDTLMPDLEKGEYDPDGYEGAIVLPPKCNIYMDNPVACVDYSSLYPSSMISQNYSHDSKVWSKEYDANGRLIEEWGEKDKSGKFVYDHLPGYEYIDIEFDTYKYLRNPEKPSAKAIKTKVGKKIVRWAQLPNDQKSIMPSILQELLKARSDTRKKIKSEADPFMQNILDKRQLGYKVTANSLYGQCGARTSTFYEKDVAASTTATGRMMIIYAKTMIEEVYHDFIYDTEKYGKVKCMAEYVYGDTDSVFFTFNLQDPETKEPIRGKKALEITIEIAQDAAHLCSEFLKPPMELSYEKTLMPFILLSKKRYVGMLYETQPTKGKLKYMGLSLKRRDSCDYLKDVYGGILTILMDESKSIQDAIQYLDLALMDLINGNVPMDKLVITKALRGYYKNSQQIAHYVLAERIGQRDPGNKPKPGDRMKFVHIVNSNKKALQGDKIETPQFILENNIQIDYSFYITNQLMKPLQQLFGLALEQIWGNKKKGIEHRRDISKLIQEFPDTEIFQKKREKMCSQKVKELVFDKYLYEIQNKKDNIQSICKFFQPASASLPAK
jgi:DNA polymerase elongation subunit (family B)